MSIEKWSQLKKNRVEDKKTKFKNPIHSVKNQSNK